MVLYEKRFVNYKFNLLFDFKSFSSQLSLLISHKKTGGLKRSIGKKWVTTFMANKSYAYSSFILHRGKNFGHFSIHPGLTLFNQLFLLLFPTCVSVLKSSDSELFQKGTCILEHFQNSSNYPHIP